jgi:AcrR family transcriptional regulator
VRASMVASGGRVRARESGGGLRRAHVGDLQRARMLSALFEVAREGGAENVTVARVVERSGASRRTFYEQFTDRDDCFFAAFEQALAHASERVLSAYEAEVGWRERIRASLVAFLSFLDEEPVIGRVLIAESLAGGQRVLERRGEVLACVTGAIDEGRIGTRAPSCSSLTAESVVGGALSILHARIARPEHKSLIELANPLMSMIVLPYLGATAARRELERPVAKATVGPERTLLLSDPFKDAGMRLTYRTVQVLVAIGEHRGASNRLVGAQVGIADQGQISKLLARLERVGMIANTGLGPGLGAPNEWALTPTGEQVVNSIRTHTENSRHESSEQCNGTPNCTLKLGA